MESLMESISIGKKEGNIWVNLGPWGCEKGHQMEEAGIGGKMTPPCMKTPPWCRNDVLVARLAISICLTLPNNYYNPSPNIHITGWQAESNPFTICFVKWPMENISFSQCPAPKSSNLPTIAFWEPNLPTKARNCNFRHFRDIICVNGRERAIY